MPDSRSTSAAATKPGVSSAIVSMILVACSSVSILLSLIRYPACCCRCASRASVVLGEDTGELRGRVACPQMEHREVGGALGQDREHTLRPRGVDDDVTRGAANDDLLEPAFA